MAYGRTIMEKYIMAIDQGTTSSRCIIFDKAGRIISKAQKEFTQIYPVPGFVEHNPLEIWSSQIAVISEAMALASLRPENIVSIGITNQRETTIIWDRLTGEPVYNAIVWQCRRTSERIDKIKSSGLGEMIRKKTGLIPDAYFSASKVEWILNNVKGAKERAQKGELMFGTVDSWLIYKLTGGKVHVTDYTNASRTMMFDIHRLCWDKEILGIFNIPENMLPKVVSSSEVYGYTDSVLLGGEIMISGAAGDQQAALFGQCCFEKGNVKNTYGTGCFMLMNTGERAIDSESGLLTTIAATADGSINYALEGSVFVAGAGIQWLRDGMKIIEDAPSSEKYAVSVPDTNGVYIVPAFAGMGAPYWNQYARGMVTGITRGTSKEHIVRAMLEAVAYQVNDVIAAMEKDSGISINTLKVDGGASANKFLMQFQADIINTRVERPECIETTALGAAYLAGLSAGYFKDVDEIRENWRLDKGVEPLMDAETRNRLLKGWSKAVRCALIWAE